MANINLAGDKLYNLNDSISVALIVGIEQTYATIGLVPDTLRYPGKFIYDEDTDNLYIIDAAKTAHVFNNAEIQISEDGTTYTSIAAFAGTNINFIKFSVDGGTTYCHSIPVLTTSSLALINAHIAATDNPHRVIATQILTIDEKLRGIVEDDLLDYVNHRDNINSANPHSLTGDVINLSSEDITAVSTAIATLSLNVAMKISKVAGHTDKFAVLNVDGALVACDELGIDDDDNIEIETSLFIGGSANSSVQSFTTSDNETYALASEDPDQTMDLLLHDKFHFTINHATHLGVIADDSRLVGLPFTIVLKGGTTGGTVSFENIPWGADFADIVLAPGDKWMITGYVYSLNEYLVKAIEF